MSMTEAEFWIQAFLLSLRGDTEDAADMADEAVAHLRRRYPVPAPQPTAQEAAATVAELRKSYPWLVLDEDGDLADPRTGGCPVIKSNDGEFWFAYVDPEADIPITCSSFAEACKAVSWPDWDAAGKDDDE